MARVTRSRKFGIAEDSTPLTLQPQSTAFEPFFQPALNEILTPNAIPIMEDQLDKEVKGLKAAYREAIGVGKRGGRKGRNNRKMAMADSEIEIEIAEEQFEEVTAGSASQKIGQLLQSRKEDTERGADAPAPKGRTTRRQLAKLQAAEEAAKAKDAKDIERVEDTHESEKTLIEGNYELAINNPDLQEVTGTDDNKNVNELLEITTKNHCSEERASELDRTTQGTLAQSPVKTFAEIENAYRPEEFTTHIDDEDSFVEIITSRSPAKPVSRIEDSVEALDKMEEALALVDQATFTIPMVSPEKERKQTSSTKRMSRVPFGNNNSLVQDAQKKARLRSTVFSGPIDRKGTPDGLALVAKLDSTTELDKSEGRAMKAGNYNTMRVKSTTAKAPIVRKTASMIFRSTDNPKALKGQAHINPVAKAVIKRPVSLIAPKEVAKSTKPLTRPIAFELPGEEIARKLREQREARLAQRQSSEDSFHTAQTISVGASKIKSSRPPTKSKFELPGEALSRKKKEAHEARLKAQEEEERKRREFNAKPLRKSVVPVLAPRETIASRARQSKIGVERAETTGLTITKREVNIGAHRPSIVTLAMANTSAPRAPGPQLSRKPSTTANGLSMSGRAMQRTVSANDVQAQRQRAKEIYNRDAKQSEDIERERREREAAAKRAREEAAERGRQASREWAEKQMAKKLASGDKGMSAGYGPGGQLGLRP